MKQVVSSQQMAEAERLAESAGIPTSLLMENAGTALAEKAIGLSGPGGRFLVVCGQGNNGGDGLVAARKLAAMERSVMVEVIGGADRLKGEPRRNYLALRSSAAPPGRIPAQLEVSSSDVVLDAIFGTGLNRPPQGAHAEAIERIAKWRAAGAKVLAADVPSGLQSDSGQAFAPCVQADVTVSFGYLKVGQVLEPGASLCGELSVAEIGLPRSAAASLPPPSAFLLEEADARDRIPERRPDTHKGTYGHVLVVAGSFGKTGAAALAALGALRAGAGLVTVASRSSSLPLWLAHAPELMGIGLDGDGSLGLADLDPLLRAADKKQAWVMGPGIPVGGETAKLIAALLREIAVPCVLDADGLNALAGRLEMLKSAKCPLILTPHPGEMARLLGKTTAEIQGDRLGAARALASGAGAVAVLKGARTVIALPDGTAFINPTGNAGMATAGSGDVLSGICGALLAQGLKPPDAAVAAVYAHGLAGDLMARRTGLMGLNASDLLEGLQDVWVRWNR